MYTINDCSVLFLEFHALLNISLSHYHTYSSNKNLGDQVRIEDIQFSMNTVQQIATNFLLLDIHCVFPTDFRAQRKTILLKNLYQPQKLRNFTLLILGGVDICCAAIIVKLHHRFNRI